MKTLKTDINDGFPFELDDLRWIADGIAESLEKSGNIIGDNFIVSGLTLTLTPSGFDMDVTHTAGKVFFGGEFCDVDALVAPLTVVSGDVAWFAKDETFDPTGNETFEDASVNDTYKIVKVKLSTGAGYPVGDYVPYLTFAADDTNRVPALIVAKIVNERIEMNNEIQFANAAAATTASNIAAGGVSELETDSNFQEIEFTAPVVDLVALDSDSASHVGGFKVIKFTGTAGATELKIVNVTGGATGTRYKIKTPTGQDMNVLTGDVCVFWNDGSNWLLVSGGRPLDVALTLGGTWTSSAAPATVVGYSKSRDGLVKLKGIAENLTYTTNTSDVIGSLPAGFRPDEDCLFPVFDNANAAIGQIQIQTTGSVRFNEAGLTAVPVAFGLSVVSFYTKQ